MKLRVIAVSGSRNWTDESAIRHTIAIELTGALKRGETLVVLHGDCLTGADAIAEEICEAEGVHSLKCPARWLKLGKKAGPIRNTVMAALKPKRCYAFPLPESRGTYDCINAMNMEDVPCVEVSLIRESEGQ